MLEEGTKTGSGFFVDWLADHMTGSLLEKELVGSGDSSGVVERSPGGTKRANPNGFCFGFKVECSCS